MGRIGQRGALPIVFVVLLALTLVMAVTIFVIESRKSDQRKEAARQSQLERDARDRAERDNQRRAQTEREALEKAAAAAKTSDVLTSSLKAVDDVMVRWTDAVKVAHSTSRGSLSGPLLQLQAIRREAKDLTVPPCLTSGRGELIQGMDLTIKGLLDFMGNTGALANALAQTSIEAAAPHFERYRADRSMCPT